MAIAKRKKKFYDVDIPIIGKQTQVEAYEASEIKDRYIKYDLTRILRGKSVELQVKIEVKGDKITAKPTRIILLPYFLRRMVRKGTNYVEDSFSTECKDTIIRIKPILVTRRKVSRAVRKALREKAKAELIEYVKNKTSYDIFDEIIKNKIQRPLSLKLKKIYPLSLCEIRVLKVEKELEVKIQDKEEKETKVEKVKEKQKEETAEELIEDTQEEVAEEKKEKKKRAKKEKTEESEE